MTDTPSLISDVDSKRHRPSVREIQEVVASAFGVRLIEMESHRRARAVARPRQIAMYLARNLTPLSLPQIGRQFGNRDHTTVIHAIEVIEAACQRDKYFAEVIAELQRRIQDAEQLALPFSQEISTSIQYYAGCWSIRRAA